MILVLIIILGESSEDVLVDSFDLSKLAYIFNLHYVDSFVAMIIEQDELTMYHHDCLRLQTINY